MYIYICITGATDLLLAIKQGLFLYFLFLPRAKAGVRFQQDLDPAKNSDNNCRRPCRENPPELIRRDIMAMENLYGLSLGILGPHFIQIFIYIYIYMYVCACKFECRFLNGLISTLEFSPPKKKY